MWLVFVVLFLQIFKKLPLKDVDVFDVAENGLQLHIGEHIRVFPALTDVALKRADKTPHNSNTGQQMVLHRGVKRHFLKQLVENSNIKNITDNVKWRNLNLANQKQTVPHRCL